MKLTKILRNFLLFMCIFIGIGALCGSLMMFFDPMGVHTGMSGLLPAFSVLPFYETLFRNLIFPGIALLLINGITNAVSSFLIIKRHKYGIFAGTLCGVILMLWITVQFVIFSANFMSILYFVLGALQFLAGLALIFIKKRG